MSLTAKELKVWLDTQSQIDAIKFIRETRGCSFKVANDVFFEHFKPKDEGGTTYGKSPGAAALEYPMVRTLSVYFMDDLEMFIDDKITVENITDFMLVQKPKLFYHLSDACKAADGEIRQRYFDEHSCESAKEWVTLEQKTQFGKDLGSAIRVVYFQYNVDEPYAVAVIDVAFVKGTV